MEQELAGTRVAGWLVERLENHGKSAAVFKVSKDSLTAALKIFDPEIVERYGRDAQRTRIEREKSLVGKYHENLIKVYDGGEYNGLLYIVMEFFHGKNLAQVLPEILKGEVRSLICQIARAAEFLESVSFAHRDIKPENIGISPDMKHAKLLDLGVIRSLDLSNVTDQGDQKFFIATLQYSPPELLFREEGQSVEEWRAITFYQLGGVIHDLLMRKPLFHEFRNPYGRMVRAVERGIPKVIAPDCEADLRLLAQNCLSKVPTDRLNSVRWSDFCQPKIVDPLDAARRRIAQHKTVATQSYVQPGNDEEQVRIQSHTLKAALHSAIVNTIKAESLPRYSTKILEERHPILIRVIFEPSPVAGLNSFFSIFCNGKITDPKAGTQEVSIAACICSTKAQVPTTVPNDVNYSKITGSLIDQDIRLHVQQALLTAFAEALDAPSENPHEVHWIRIGNKI